MKEIQIAKYLQIIAKNLKREVENNSNSFIQENVDICEELTRIEANVIFQETVEGLSLLDLSNVSCFPLKILFRRFEDIIMNKFKHADMFEKGLFLQTIYHTKSKSLMRKFGKALYLTKIDGYYIIDCDRDGFNTEETIFDQTNEEDYVEHINKIFS